MKIGIDIDGCLANIARFIADYGSKFCYENNIDYMVEEKEYNVAKAMGISDEDTERFWNKYLPYYATKYKARDFAAEVIKLLKEKNEIYIITARNEDGLPPEFYGYMQEMVLKWLEENNIEYDKIIFSKGSKLPYCLENKIDIMVEDSPRNIMEISTKIPVLCFDNPYNKKIKGANIKRVYSWYDVLSKIQTSDKK